MIELNEEQRQAVSEHPDEPIALVDSATRQTYVLLRTQAYDRLKNLVFDASECSISEAYPLMDKVLAKEGWDDPAHGRVQSIRSEGQLMKRGDVVIVDWPFARIQGSMRSKPRPALVVQNDRDNARLTNTILAMITSVTKRATEATQCLVELNTPDGQMTGLVQDSVVNCVNLMSVEQNKVLHVIGKFSAHLMGQVNDCLKAALELP